MFNFKILLKCCCENSGNTEEEKREKIEKLDNQGNQSRKNVFNPAKNATDTSIQKILEENSVIAAPSPFQDKDSMAYPKLQLKIIESSSNQTGAVLHINATGMEESKRGKADYKTYIGCQLMENDEIINDYVIDEEDHGMGKQHILIKFQPTTCKYLISDLGDGTGTFAKVGIELVLKDGYIISFGNSHMKIISTGSPNILDKKLVIKFLEGPKINEDYTFQPSDDTILIGRMGDCRIRFDDSNLSRYQCNISYHQTKGWILKDGIGDKKSTNGTWLYVEEEFEIYDKLIFKAGKTLFEATLE